MSLLDPQVVAFEAGAIDPATFRHRDHLYIGWCYLRALTLEDAIARFVVHLRALLVTLAATDKLHVTVTWAYLVVMNDCMQEAPEQSFDELLVAHPELLAPRHGCLLAHYTAEELASPRARQRFVLPRSR